MYKKSLFGTSGIRGSEIELFTDQFCFDLGRTFSIFLTKNKLQGGVAIGMDPRGSSPRIKEFIESGLAYEGREVFDQGATPVPSMCYLLTISDTYGGSIMVSGSHIKPELNGVKFFAFKEEILKHHEREIQEIYFSIKDQVAFKSIDSYQVTDEQRANSEYVEMLIKLAQERYPKWRVVVDPGDGAQSDTMPLVLKRLGVDVVEINSTIQGEFFARDTEHLPDMQGLIDAVKKLKADFGIGYDADGDRVVFIDEKGNFVPGDYSATIIAREYAKYSIVTTIAASQVVEHLGKKVYRTKVGSPYVLEKMKQIGANIGFEPNGGCFFPQIAMTRDGGSTTVHFLNILRQSGKSVSQIISELPNFYLSKDKIDYDWALENAILEKAKKTFKGIKTETLDGLKIWLGESTWILFRSSQNAPEFRVFAESKDKLESENLLKEGINLVKSTVL